MVRSKSDRRIAASQRHCSSSGVKEVVDVFEFDADADGAGMLGRLGSVTTSQLIHQLNDVKTPPAAEKRKRNATASKEGGLKSNDPLSRAQGYKSSSSGIELSTTRLARREEIASSGEWHAKTSAPVVPRKKDVDTPQNADDWRPYLLQNQSRDPPAKGRVKKFARKMTGDRRRMHQPRQMAHETVEIHDDDEDDSEAQKFPYSRSSQEDSLCGTENAYSGALQNLKKDRQSGSQHSPLPIYDDDENNNPSKYVERFNWKPSRVKGNDYEKEKEEPESSWNCQEDLSDEDRRKGRTKKQPGKPLQSKDEQQRSSKKRRMTIESESDNDNMTVYRKGKKKMPQTTTRKPAAFESASKVLDLDVSPSRASNEFKYFSSEGAVRGGKRNEADDHTDDKADRIHIKSKKLSQYPNVDYAKSLKRRNEIPSALDSPESIKGGICQSLQGDSSTPRKVERAMEAVLAGCKSASTANRALEQTESKRRLFGDGFKATQETFSISKKNGGFQGNHVGRFAKQLMGKSPRKGKPLNQTSIRGSRSSLFSAQISKIEEEDPIQDADFEEREFESWVPKRQSKYAAKSSRKTHRPSHGADNPIEIADSDDDVEASNIPMARLGTESKRKSSRHFREIGLARVTVGERYSQWSCVLQLKKDMMVLHYEVRSENQEDGVSKVSVMHEIHVDDIRMFRHHKRTNEMVLAIFRIEPTASNGLKKCHVNYLQEESAQHEAKNRRKAYIVCELRSHTDLEDILIDWLRGQPQSKAFAEDVEGIEKAECLQYSEVLEERIDRDKKDREECSKSSRKRRRSRRLGSSTKRSNNEILLIFPFGAHEQEIDRAAENLLEAKSVTIHSTNYDSTSYFSDTPLHGMEGSPVLPWTSSACRDQREVQNKEECFGPTTHETDGSGSDEKGREGVTDSNDETVKQKGRAHYLTIRDEDFERLEPGEFLNDTLIDFWMQWMMRKEDRSTSPLHVFTSHFYTTLSEDGTSAVETWTAKKNIDVFTKKYIFLPINKHLHWSLCVVVNPGNIVDTNTILSNTYEDLDDEELDQPVTSILFLDSLQAHQKKIVFKHVKRWLNAEWKRLKKPSLTPDPFNSEALEIVSPRIPYQDNSWDCGVFVCRYAYAIYMRRHTYLKIQDSVENYESAITQSLEFDFNMGDIRRFRKELKILVINLSTIYKAWSNKEELAKKEGLREEKNTSSTSLLEGEKNLEGSLSALCKGYTSKGDREASITEPMETEKQETVSTALEAAGRTQSELLDHGVREDETADEDANVIATSCANVASEQAEALHDSKEVDEQNKEDEEIGFATLPIKVEEDANEDYKSGIGAVSAPAPGGMIRI